jgi:hypothetical protein
MDEKILLWIVVGLGAVLLGVFVLLTVVPLGEDKISVQEVTASIQDNTAPAEPLEQETASPITKEEIPPSEAAVTEKQAELSKAQRESIHYETWELVYKARAQAEATYPLPHPNDPGYTQAAFLEQNDKQFELQMKLEKQYLEELASRVGITYQDVRDLVGEGYEKAWPKPPFPD